MYTRDKWIRYLATLGPAFLLGGEVVHAQMSPCVSSCTDSNSDSGYKKSINGPACLMPPPPDCLPSMVSRGLQFLSVLHPGLLLEFHGGNLRVARVLEGSPAESAGVESGDIVIAINGERPGQEVESPSWGSQVNPTMTNLTVQREGSQFTIPVKLIPIRLLLKSAWHSDISRVSYTIPAEPTVGGPDAPARPFTAGLQVRLADGRLVVDAVLTGSPADYAGIRIGDQILTINGAGAESLPLSAIAEQFDSFAPRTITLTALGASGESKISLVTSGLSSILGHVRNRNGHSADVIALADK